MQRKRFVYLDVFRGFIIFIMLLVHPLVGLMYGSDPGALNTVSIWVLVLCAPFAIVTTWAPVFALTSGTANAYVMFMMLKDAEHDPVQARRLLFRGLLNGVMLYLFSVMSMSFLHHSMEFNGKWHHTLLTGYMVRGAMPSFSPEFLFFNDALAFLSVTGILTTILLHLLWRNGGIEKLWRTYIVVGGLAIAMLLASAWLHDRLDVLFFHCLDEKRWLSAFALKSFIGPRFSPVPFTAYALAGALFGVGLANGAGPATFRRFGYGSGLVLLALFAVEAARTGFHFVELTWNTVPTKIHFLDMGLIVIVATLLLDLSEFRSSGCRGKLMRWTVILQRFGRVSLSIFLTETFVSVLLLKAYLPLWGTDVFPRQPQAIVPFLAIVVLLWACIVSVWERYGYRYGIEWLLIWLNQKLVGHASERLKISTADNTSTD